MRSTLPYWQTRVQMRPTGNNFQSCASGYTITRWKGTTWDWYMWKNPDALSLLTAIEQFFMAKNVDLTKVRFLGFDGTNTMSGEVTGLQRRIRHLSPHCIYINCRNHRLALCLKHLMKEYPLLVEVDSILLSVWKLFEYSPQTFSMFNDIQETYGLKPLTLIRAATTRWLSHLTACTRLSDRFVQVLDVLDDIYNEKKDPEIYGIRARLL